MIHYIICWIAAIIFVEAVVEIEVNSVLFAGFRARIARIKLVGWYFNGLFSCGYCLSVWVSAIAAAFVPGNIVLITESLLGHALTNDSTVAIILDYVVKIFVIHRLANKWHELVYRWLERMPFILAFKNDQSTSRLNIPANIDLVELKDDNGEENTQN